MFDGIACGRVALDRAGIAVSAYEAYEIDKFPRSISRYNYPDIRHHGDVLGADFSQFAGYDLVMGGSPCTFWSIAKNDREVDKNGMGWKLFMCFVEAVRIIKPKCFLYENVASMPANIKAYISEELGSEPIFINSALVSAQQRKRLYWTNIKGVEQPEDKGILLKDILESGMVGRDKSLCIDACYYKGGNHTRPQSQSGQRRMVYEPIALADKSQTILSTMYKENALSMLKRGKTGLFVAESVDKGAALRTRADENGSFKRLEVRSDDKLNSLTTVQTDSVICSPVRLGVLGKGGQGERIYSVHGKTVTLSANGGGRGAKTGLYKINLPDGDYIVRKLTPIEAERCQTLSDNYTAMGIDDNGKTVKISNTQRYKGVGNGWTIDVIAHILSFAKLGGDF
ncbi:DNA cytosine methyltransferase [Alkalibaculum bacchi]|uniref:DNA cytosine methyltransferase n=1 Tax=Alkalibaculum bacchi TaxID=645887 RepID=UPI0026F1E548|nr:DNA cytosine methyltransferase [Alkalibaculum bacchi]